MTDVEPIAIAITDAPIHVGQASQLTRHRDGALVTFVGVVRGDTEGEAVVALEYESYDQMAEEEMRRIAQEAIDRWDITRVMIVHRVGRLEVGEASVLVAVSAPHRAEAFDACEYCIDTLKQRVPIWKKEIFASGDSRWVDHP